MATVGYRPLAYEAPLLTGPISTDWDIQLTGTTVSWSHQPACHGLCLSAECSVAAAVCSYTAVPASAVVQPDTGFDLRLLAGSSLLESVDLRSTVQLEDWQGPPVTSTSPRASTAADQLQQVETECVYAARLALQVPPQRQPIYMLPFEVLTGMLLTVLVTNADFDIAAAEADVRMSYADSLR